MSHILDTQRPPHTIIRGKFYYLNMRVPKVHQQVHGQIIRAKLSDDIGEASRLALHISQLVKKAWSTNHTSKINIEKVIAASRPKTIVMSEITEEYVAIRGIHANPIKVALGSLFEVAGDRDVRSYTREDARALLVHLKSTGIKTSTIRKRLACVGAIINYAYHEFEVEKRNPFSKMIIVGEGQDATKRGTFTTDQLIDGYDQAFASKSNIQLLFPILGETGCRLAEIVGLRVEDIDWEAKLVNIRPNTKRRLKTSGSERIIPLNTTAFLALEKAAQMTTSEWLFPRYIKENGCYATHASNALAKWTKRRWGMTAHSLRHTFRDRLRAVEAPLEAIDQLGGWSSVKTIGSSYGRGYSVEHLKKYLDAICTIQNGKELDLHHLPIVPIK